MVDVPGTLELHNHSHATHAGHYAAPPATAELMYGGASVARTAAARLTISGDLGERYDPN